MAKTGKERREVCESIISLKELQRHPGEEVRGLVSHGRTNYRPLRKKNKKKCVENEWDRSSKRDQKDNSYATTYRPHTQHPRGEKREREERDAAKLSGSRREGIIS